MTAPATPIQSRWQRLRIPLLYLLIIGIAAWWVRPDGRLHITLLNTPGDAILIQTPTGAFILIDGGSDPTQLSSQLGSVLPFWQRRLDLVVLTAATGKRLPGQVAALARYDVRAALAPADLPRGGTASEWRRLIEQQGTRASPLRSGARYDLGGAQLAVLAADTDGAVLLIRYGATQALFHTGSPQGDSAAASLAGTPIHLLAFPWQRELATAPVAQLRPQRIIFTNGYSVDEPALRSYAERQQYSPLIYHPKVDGQISWISDGRQTWVVTRGP
jgi:hypothetical protein